MEHQQSSYYDAQGQKRSCEESGVNRPSKYQLTENMPPPPPPPPVKVVAELDPIMFQIQGERYLSAGYFKGQMYARIQSYNLDKETGRPVSVKYGQNFSQVQWERLKVLMPYLDRDMALLAAKNANTY